MKTLLVQFETTEVEQDKCTLFTLKTGDTVIGYIKRIYKPLCYVVRIPEHIDYSKPVDTEQEAIDILRGLVANEYLAISKRYHALFKG